MTQNLKVPNKITPLATQNPSNLFINCLVELTPIQNSEIKCENNFYTTCITSEKEKNSAGTIWFVLFEMSKTAKMSQDD